MTKPYRLSKSRIAAFLQCPKRLWLEVHRPELREETLTVQAAFAVGHRVGDLARAEYPGGVLVLHDENLRAALEETGDLFARHGRLPVFEATFQHAGVLVRADVMIPLRRGWHMAELKSAGEAKPYHPNDLAVQTWVARGAGVRVGGATVCHIDKSFVYPGGDDYRGLLVDAEVGDELQERLPEVPKWVERARSTLGKREPRREMGAHCDDPFARPFKVHCESLAGPRPEYPVELLSGPGGKKLRGSSGKNVSKICAPFLQSGLVTRGSNACMRLRAAARLIATPEAREKFLRAGRIRGVISISKPSVSPCRCGRVRARFSRFRSSGPITSRKRTEA